MLKKYPRDTSSIGENSIEWIIQSSRYSLWLGNDQIFSDLILWIQNQQTAPWSRVQDAYACPFRRNLYRNTPTCMLSHRKPCPEARSSSPVSIVCPSPFTSTFPSYIDFLKIVYDQLASSDSPDFSISSLGYHQSTWAANHPREVRNRLFRSAKSLVWRRSASFSASKVHPSKTPKNSWRQLAHLENRINRQQEVRILISCFGRILLCSTNTGIWRRCS